ncbi:MAG: GFA family protein [Parvibaculaceae bacterium]
MDRDEKITGGCQCGGVRYRIEGPLGHAGVCHCRMCQKAFGSWGAPLVSVPATRLSWTRGKPGAFRSSPVVDRGFCRDCGTPLYMKEEGDPNYEIAIGSLDDPELAPPTSQAGVESELSWFRTLPALPGHRTEDDRAPADLAKLRSLQHPDHETDRWPEER